MSDQAVSTTTVLSMLTSLPAIVICGFIAIGLWAGVVVQTVSIIDDRNIWQFVGDQVTKVIGTTMTATMVLLAVSMIYFLQDQSKSIYVVFIMIGLAACLSYSAMAAAVAN